LVTRRVANSILSMSMDAPKAKMCKSFWSTDRLIRFIKKVKVEFKPILTAESSEILMRYYQLQRQADLRNSARTTVRLLESLVRLSQGHAKLMCHDRVEIIDAVFAIILMESSFDSQSVCGLKLDVMEHFPSDPEENYQSSSNFHVIKRGAGFA
jgi:DNA helicase MCM9